MRRMLSIWFSRWRIERQRRALSQAARYGSAPAQAALEALEAPLALIAPGRHGPVIEAVTQAAARAGLRPGQSLSDARALYPALATRPVDAAGDIAALDELAGWLERYSPLIARDGADGLLADLTGVAHLFGGEQPLLADLADHLALAGLTARLGLAATIGAAHALARYGPARINRIGPEEQAATALAPLPLAALRLAPDTVAAARRLGLKRIGDLAPLPRAGLARRFRGDLKGRIGAALLGRLDQALGRVEEPLTPRRPPPAYRAGRRFAEPVAAPEDLARVLADLSQDLAHRLAQDHQGARHLVLSGYRVDHSVVRLSAGTARATRDGAHLIRLFSERLAGLDPGFGLDAMSLAAVQVERLEAAVCDFTQAQAPAGELAALVDRLSDRLGRGAVYGLAPQPRHRPEAAQALRPAVPPLPWHDQQAPDQPPRPITLFDPPQPIAVVAEVPDGPPLLFRWRRLSHKVVRAAGPERIASDWWQSQTEPMRDYYRVEDADGRRFWLFRAGTYDGAAAPAWYLHGLFA